MDVILRVSHSRTMFGNSASSLAGVHPGHPEVPLEAPARGDVRRTSSISSYVDIRLACVPPKVTPQTPVKNPPASVPGERPGRPRSRPDGVLGTAAVVNCQFPEADDSSTPSRDWAVTWTVYFVFGRSS